MRLHPQNAEHHPASGVRWARRAVTLLAIGLAGIMTVSTALPAVADTLADRQKALQQAIANSNQSVARDAAALASATQTLTNSQMRLAAQQAILDHANAQLAIARQVDAQDAAKLAQALQDLATAKAAVVVGKQKLTAEQRLAAISLQQSIQQSNPLEGIAAITTNLGTGDINQRIQWAHLMLTVTQTEADRLAMLEAQLVQAQQEQAAATAEAQQARLVAAAELTATRALQSEASAAKAAVAAEVAANTAAQADTHAQLLVSQSKNTSLKTSLATVNRQIAAARAAAARRAAAEARARAAAEAAARAANNADAAQNAANQQSGSSNYTPTSSYAAAAGYGDVDPWGFYWGECVSYAAWKVRTTTRYTGFADNYTYHGISVHFGNAYQWAAAAQAIGVAVDTHPTVGSIAWRSTGTAGHVAYVTAVHSDGTINVAEYNFAAHHQFDMRTYVAWWQGGSAGFTGFIHF